MKVFSLARFYYDSRECDISFKIIKVCMSWANRCHGQVVIDNSMRSKEFIEYYCKDEWTKEVAEND